MNLKSTELRIGNWYAEFGIPKQITPHLIARLHEIEQAGKIVIDCTALPLTDDWLLRFGFEFNGEVWVNEGRGLILTRYLNYLNFTPSGSEYVGQIKIEYVHQLQNLYFALTGQELEIKNPSPTNADKGQLS